LRGTMNGLDFLVSESELLGAAACLLVTGDAGATVREQADAASIPLISKPVDAQELIQMLEDIANM
jgi:hypothetical protein